VSNTEAMLIELPHFLDGTGSLTVLEGEDKVPFLIKRVFIVYAQVGEVRGQHAHRLCSQFMICSSGSVEVVTNNGKDEHVYLLNTPNIGLMVPPALWAQETYLESDSVLTVLCDMNYDPEDYIHGIDEFMKIYGGRNGR
jgi:dTDP-4-dehydrorhamnose 3,5-epimerase-like enzyme